MDNSQRNFIDLLIRIFIRGESFEKASIDEVRKRMAILSLLCTCVILAFHFMNYFEFIIDRYSKTNTDLFIYIIIPFAIIAGASRFLYFYIFSHFNKFISITIAILLTMWVVVEIIIKMKEV